MSAIEVKVPDLGEVKDAEVIELMIKVGDTVRADQSLISLESEKATLDVPTPVDGTVKEIKVSVGDKVSKGAVILLLETGGTSEPSKSTVAPARKEAPVKASPAPAISKPARPAAAEPTAGFSDAAHAHATPSVRRLARELGVPVAQVRGSGPKGRITADDLKLHVKTILTSVAASGGNVGLTGGLNILPWPKIDFSTFGPVEAKPLSRVRKLISANLGRNWVMIPHVTQFDSADITEIEAHRVALNKAGSAEGVKITMLAYLVKACVQMLKQFPDFNASLDGETLIMKGYFNIGFAADTPQGLMVPVIRDADGKSVMQIALETSTLAAKARDGKITAAEMQGGCFTISSLGGVGGTFFTPIINAPEVAILGVSRNEMHPRWNGKEFVPRLMLPLSLSYDHRVIDGAAAARFTRQLAEMLADVKNIPA
jgi:pyruvate dehydrogenase E2 component (dihydrolipoamide acetyltransferase)